LSETSMFSLQTLTESSYWFITKEIHRQAWSVIVEVLGYSVLQEVPILN
jgi:hypothetical protein